MSTASARTARGRRTPALAAAAARRMHHASWPSIPCPPRVPLRVPLRSVCLRACRSVCLRVSLRAPSRVPLRVLPLAPPRAPGPAPRPPPPAPRAIPRHSPLPVAGPGGGRAAGERERAPRCDVQNRDRNPTARLSTGPARPLPTPPDRVRLLVRLRRAGLRLASTPPSNPDVLCALLPACVHTLHRLMRAWWGVRGALALLEGSGLASHAVCLLSGARVCSVAAISSFWSLW